METIRITVNGRVREDRIATPLLLCDYLRDVAGLTGTSAACDTHRCGGCMVLLDGDVARSCSMFAVQAAGSVIETIEGVEAAGEHAIRRELRAAGTAECHACVAGRIMVAEALIRSRKRLTTGEVERALEGNPCTCGTAGDFADAVLRILKERERHRT